MPTTSAKRLNPAARTLGAETFAAITAVEGLKLNASSPARLHTLKASGLSTDERRAEVRRAYARGDRAR